MNTIFTGIIDPETNEVVDVEMNDNLAEAAIASLIKTNTFVPGIDRILYNFKKADGDAPATLATIVYFKDGTKTTVKNVAKDAVTTTKETIRLSDGSVKEVETASRESKEVGLAYAIVKRVVCGSDKPDGKMSGFVSWLNHQLDRAYCQDVEVARDAAEKKIAKARHEAKMAAVKDEKPAETKKTPKKNIEALNNTIKGLAEVLTNLRTMVSSCEK